MADYNQIYQQQLSQAQGANAGVISSLEGQKPTLEAQYKSAIDSLKGQQGQAIQNTNTQTSRDFGARGIPLSSGVFSQTLGERTQPIVTQYTNEIGKANTGYQNSLSDLATRIAQAQAGISDTATRNSQYLYSQQQSAEQAAADRAFQAQQNSLSRNASASQASAALLAQQKGYQQALDYQNAQTQKGLVSGATGYLSGANINGGKYTNTSVDKNELDQAYAYLVGQNVSKNDAIKIIQNAYSSGGFTPYQLSPDAKKFYGI